MYNNVIITAANDAYYDSLLTLISSIHTYSYNIVDKIFVYDLGLNINNINNLKRIKKVEILNFNINPLPYKDYLLPKGHAYKLFCLYNAASLSQNIFWLDAGVCLLQDISDIFKKIQNEGIFLVGDKHLNINYTKKACINIMKASQEELQDVQLSSGIIGYNINSYFLNLIKEAYEYSLIEDCVVGDEENHRHDQSVLSILASRYKCKKYDIDIYGYWTDSNRNLKTAIENNAIIFVHRRGYINKEGILYNEL